MSLTRSNSSFLYYLISSPFTLENRSVRQKIQNYKNIFYHSHCGRFLHCSDFTVYTAVTMLVVSNSDSQGHNADLQVPMSNTVSCAENGLCLQKYPISMPDMTPVHSKHCSRLSGPPKEEFLRTTFPQKSLSQFNMYQIKMQSTVYSGIATTLSMTAGWNSFCLVTKIMILH